MAGPVPAIHVFSYVSSAKTWMPGTSPGMTSSLRAFLPRSRVAVVKATGVKIE